MSVVNLLPSRKDNSITHKVLSRNKIKYLGSLKIKKFRNIHGQFIIEGDKIVRDILHDGHTSISLLIATESWMAANQVRRSIRVKEIIEADMHDLSRISSLETPAEVMAILDVEQPLIDFSEIANSLSIALDNIQDPGNLGTIIRTADWFGIQNIFCSNGCTDCYNPKVVQASMGALLHVKTHYTDLPELLGKLSENPDYVVFGTFMEGQLAFEIPPVRKGIVVFGNESRGISDDLMPFIRSRITIPSVGNVLRHVESLNVASAVAIVCSVLTMKD